MSLLKRHQKSSPERLLSEYPSGTFIQTEKGDFYVHSTTERYRFITKRCLNSWSPHRIVKTTEDHPAVKKLRIIAKMKFRNGSLLYSQPDGKMYLVSEGKLRHIISPDVLSQLSMERKEAVWVSEEEIKLHQMGRELS